MCDVDIKFDDQGLIPAIIQDIETDEVLMMAYMNKESLDKTLMTGKTFFWSRSRKRLWQKGEESGNIQQVKEIYYDCDKDTLLVKVIQKGGACHTGHRSCFYRKLEHVNFIIPGKEDKDFGASMVHGKATILQSLYDTIMDRKKNPREGSYTSYLFEKGIDKILKKVGEESSEVIIGAKNGDEDEVVYETADLFYHLIVMLVDQGITLDRIYEELGKRRRSSQDR
ncbi:MAG TPA: bifunctional phosphoribosyl-AMP cyclohydrolase/phosphoribosyl-ATP diphosphatase HisIE [Clostridia bacterium]|nr:bifunctional phosphoribosyl-AMP cyclohydrolase/phosphoribosyl-ATP diphosphatase HisIE [Clostridia bacterium]